MNEAGKSDYWKTIWRRFKDGDKEAFAVLYNFHVDRLFRYGTKLCYDTDMVKDAIQEIFLDLYLKRETNRTTPENLKYYLLLALKRNLIKKLKVNRKFDFGEFTDVKLPNTEFSVEYQIISNELEEEISSKLYNALSQLPDKQKEAVYLRFNEAMDYTEISVIMGITVESVRKQVYRALKAVREIIEGKTIILFILFFQKKIKKTVHV
jgi:RNA polymerase sigma factor (sigma-70 family)